jgi:hypothetical protein
MKSSPVHLSVGLLGSSPRSSISALVALMAALAASTAAAQEPKAEEISRIDLDLRKQRKSPESFKKTRLLTQWALCMFGFMERPYSETEDERVVAAYRRFQTDAHLPLRDQLDARTFLALMLREKVLLPQGTLLPADSFHATPDYVVASGTWVGIGATISDPLQTTKMECFRQGGFCFTATAKLANTFGDTSLNVDTEILDIERWDTAEITTKPQDAACVRWITRINLVTRAVTSSRTTISNEKGCQAFNGDWTLKLVNGLQTSMEAATSASTNVERRLGRDCGSSQMRDWLEDATRVKGPTAKAGPDTTPRAIAGAKLPRTVSTGVVSSQEVEPNDTVQQATRIDLGTEIQGTIGATSGEGDRDLYVATVAAGPHRFTLSGVADLNLAVEVMQLGGGEKLVRRLFLDDQGTSEGERVDGLLLAAGEVFFRVLERPFCTEPNRPSREKSLVPYTLLLAALTTDALAEVEPNDTPSTAQALPLTRAVIAWAGDRVDVEKLAALRPDAPFSSADWFRVEGPADVMVAVVPPERGVLLVVDGAALEAFQRKSSKTLGVVAVTGGPQWVELKPMADGHRRLRVLAGEDVPPGAEYWLAAGMRGDNGLAAVIDLGRSLDSRSRLKTKRLLLDATRLRFAGSSDLSRLGEN